MAGRPHAKGLHQGTRGRLLQSVPIKNVTEANVARGYIVVYGYLPTTCLINPIRATISYMGDVYFMGIGVGHDQGGAHALTPLFLLAIVFLGYLVVGYRRGIFQVSGYFKWI